MNGKGLNKIIESATRGHKKNSVKSIVVKRAVNGGSIAKHNTEMYDGNDSEYALEDHNEVAAHIKKHLK